jgi:hypothetical protein
MAQQAAPIYHRQNYHTHDPNPPLPIGMVEPGREWHHITQRLPYPINKVATLRLSTWMPNPDELDGNDNPSVVNEYLTDLQKAFPHLPAAQNPRINGVKILGREVAGTTPTSLGAFPDMPQAFYAASTVGSEVRKQAGTLILVASSPNIVWETSHIAVDLRDQINRAQAANNQKLVTQLQATFEQQRKIHQDGQIDWYNSVLFIKGKKLWLYDPSAITCQFIPGSNTRAEQVYQELENDTLPAHGIDCRGVANLNMVREIFIRCYHNRGNAPLGRRDNLEGFYIGGGGNILRATPGEFLENTVAWGDCRPMCGNFIALIATLLWAEEDIEDLTEEEVRQQRVNIDWMLGGLYNGLAKDDVEAQQLGIPQWWRYYCY